MHPLVGRHVTMEPLRLEHLPGLLAAATRESRDSFRWTWVPADEAGMRAYVETALADAAAGSAVPFATVAGGRVVGSTRFGNLERWFWRKGERPADTIDAAEIGWTWLTPSAQRTPVNTEAKLLMLGHAFEVWRVERVTLKTDARNERSRAAIERLGAKLDGLLRAHMPATDDRPRTSAVYSILLGEWPAVKAGLQARL
jgi:RimJ/RimL family protein N-acetyltransferase